MKRDVEKTYKYPHPNCIKAPPSTLGQAVYGLVIMMVMVMVMVMVMAMEKIWHHAFHSGLLVAPE